MILKLVPESELKIKIENESILEVLKELGEEIWEN